MYTGIEFNNQHSYKDFGLTISNREIGYPSKIKRQERVPFSNEIYDFSDIYKGQEYNERTLTYTFNVIDTKRIKNYKETFTNIQLLETQIANWIMNMDGKTILKDDIIPGYYFLAEVVSDPTSRFRLIGSEFTVHFTAYPFKISELQEGHDIWDDFNFLLDYSQDTKFDISGSEEVTLYNPGTSVIQPTIIADSSFEIKKGNAIYNISKGTTKSYDLVLIGGENTMTIEGNGTISFEFYKELI